MSYLKCLREVLQYSYVFSVTHPEISRFLIDQSDFNYLGHIENIVRTGSLSTIQIFRDRFQTEESIQHGFHMSTKYGWIHLARFFLEKGALNSSQGLYFAILNCRVEMVKFLLNRGAQISLTDHNPLNAISAFNQWELVEIFFEQGIDLRPYVTNSNQEAFRCFLDLTMN